MTSAISSGPGDSPRPAAAASVSVIILTLNEQDNIDAAIDSVLGWASEVFVVDSFSTDGTVAAVLSRRDERVRVVQHKFENYSSQWNWALRSLPLTGEWTLKLDADERVTPEFRKEADALLSALPTAVHGISFRRSFFFFGRELRFGGIDRNYDLRLWRTGKAAFEDRPVNEHALVKGDVVTVKSKVEHHDFKDLSAWIEKHNRYSSFEACCLLDGNLVGEVAPRAFGSAVERRVWLRTIYRRVPFRPVLYFLYRYLFELGLLDGVAGLRYWILHAFYLWWIDLKYGDALRTGRRPAIGGAARGQPDPVVAGSELQRSVDAAVAEPVRRV